MSCELASSLVVVVLEVVVSSLQAREAGRSKEAAAEAAASFSVVLSRNETQLSMNAFT